MTFYIVYFLVLASSLRHFKTRYIKCFVNLKFYFFLNSYLLLLSHYFENITTINVVLKRDYLKTSPCKFPQWSNTNSLTKNSCVTLSPVTQPNPSCVLMRFYLIIFLFPLSFFHEFLNTCMNNKEPLELICTIL